MLSVKVGVNLQLCQEVGHTRKKCPEITCRICKEKGHMSYVCEKRNVWKESEDLEEQAQSMSTEERKDPVKIDANEAGKSESSLNMETATNSTTTIILKPWKPNTLYKDAKGSFPVTLIQLTTHRVAEQRSTLLRI